MLLHIIKKQNPNNKIKMTLNIFYVYHGGLKYIFTEVIYVIIT
jgi:hypothetical protein